MARARSQIQYQADNATDLYPEWAVGIRCLAVKLCSVHATGARCSVRATAAAPFRASERTAWLADWDFDSSVKSVVWKIARSSSRHSAGNVAAATEVVDLHEELFFQPTPFQQLVSPPPPCDA